MNFMYEMGGKGIHLICRLCLGEKTELLDVFKSKGIPGWSAADAIMELLSIQVSASDIYPHYVCMECMKKLEDFKLFKNQCESNKELLDCAHARNLGVGSNEEHVKMGLCSDENKHGFYLDEKDVEISVQEDPLDMNVGFNYMKAEIEKKSNDFNEISTSEVIGTADHISIPRKSGYKHQEENCPCKNVQDSDIRIKQEPLDITLESGSDGYFEECITGAAEAEITPRVCYNTDFSKRKKNNSYTTDRSSRLKNDNRGVFIETGPLRAPSFSKMGDIIGCKEEVTEPIPSNTEANCNSCDASIDELTYSRVGEGHTCNIKGKSTQEPLMHSACPKEFSVDYNLGIQEEVSDDGNAFKCIECLKKFSTADCLRRHMLIHSGEKPFQCTECSKTFCQKSHLKTHMLTHSGEKAFHCIECKKSFSLKENFKRHMVTHTGERPFVCDQCSMTFSWKSSLNRHMLTHSGQTPFTCNICVKTFSQKSSLNRHMLTHSGETPFTCNQCSKSFSQKNSLLRHIQTHRV